MHCDHVKRRLFLALLGSAAMGWSAAAREQQPSQMRRLGVLIGNAEDRESQSWIAALRQELAKLGWIEGRNIEITIRWAGADVASMKQFAGELVALRPDIVLTQSTPGAAAMLEQTRTIPVVFVSVADPVGSGYVASLPRPGGNATGFTPIVHSLGGKWLELLKEIAPRIASVAMLFNPTTAGTFVQGYVGSFKAAAASAGVEAIIAPVQNPAELQSHFTTQAHDSNNAVVVIPDAFTQHHLAEIAALSARYRLPAVYWSRSFPEIGGLMSYGPYLVDEYRRAAAYLDRILKGEKPSDLPIQAPVKFELVINLNTVKAFGLTVPSTLLVLADEVIE